MFICISRFIKAPDERQFANPHWQEMFRFWEKWFCRETARRISGTVTFNVTTNMLLKYNPIAFKLLTELVLARVTRH
jgi:hypothetical protein